MPAFSVIVTDSPFPNLDPAREILSKIGAVLKMAEASTPDATASEFRNADAVLVTYAKIQAEAIRQMKKCRIISRFGIGVDNVDISAATAAGIVVTRVPDYCIDEVSDHTLAFLLALVRKIPFANSMSHAGGWDMSAVAPIHRLRGTVLGLVGFGRIPQLVAPKAKAFGIRVITSDPFVSKDTLKRAAVERVDFKELLALSDYISIHTPLLPETHHLFNAQIFASMKPTAYLINTSRGPVIDEAALADALDQGLLGGAALDVLSPEPPKESRLFGRSNVILTPHMSFYSVESLVDLQIKASEEVARALTGKRVLNPVNPEAVQRDSQNKVDTAQK